MSIQIKDFGKTTAGQPVKVGILGTIPSKFIF